MSVVNVRRICVIIALTRPSLIIQTFFQQVYQFHGTTVAFREWENPPPSFRLLFIRFRYPSPTVVIVIVVFVRSFIIDSSSLSSSESSSWASIPEDFPLQSSSLIPGLQPSIPSIIPAILVRRSVEFIESIQHALAMSSYPLQLRDVIECCHHDLRSFCQRLMWVSKGDQSSLDAAPAGAPT